MHIEEIRIRGKVILAGILAVTILTTFTALSGSAQAAACAPANGLGSVTQTSVTVNAAGVHNVWVRMRAGDALANSVGVEVTPSGGAPSCLVASSQNITDWEWRNVGSITVTKTGNTIRLVGLAANVKVDRVILVSASSSNCIPSNSRDTTKSPIEEPGDNCIAATSPPTATITSTPPPTATITSTPSPPTTDKNPPTAPSNISRLLVLDIFRFRYNLQLKWTPSADAEGAIKHYSVVRNDGMVSNSLRPDYVDNEVVVNTKYTYTIQAFDMAGNASRPIQTSLTTRCLFVWCWLE
ncbi:hypothetical protein IT415_02390 [bacterium]|nr:hypothetical protein [bacterium]